MRDRAIDSLRTISILAVILIHTTSRSIESVHMNLPSVPWALFLNQTARFAVPVFFLISGFVLELSHKEGVGYFFYLEKRLGKIALPYIFWSFIYYYFVYTNHNVSFPAALVGGNASYQLYFISSLLILYLIFPLLHKFADYFIQRRVLLLVGFFQLWLLYTDYYRHGIALFDPLRITLLNGYYFIFGIAASHHINEIKAFAEKFRYPLMLITAIIGTYVFYEGYSRYLISWNYIDFYSQWRPSIFLYSLAVFLGGYYWLTRLQHKFDWLEHISGQSFLVFFIHVWVLEKVWSVIRGLPVTNIWFDPMFFSLVAILSFISSYLLHKIPWLSKLTG